MMARRILFNPEPAEIAEAQTCQHLIDSLYDALKDSEHARIVFPALMECMLDREVWKHDRIFPGGGHQGPISFHDLIHQRYPVGLSQSGHEAIRRYIGGDAALLARYDRLCRRPDGNPTGRNQYSEPVEEQSGTLYAVQGSSEPVATAPSGEGEVVAFPPKAPTGNSKQAGLRRLDKAAEAGDSKAVELYRQVCRDELSVNAACREMGWRKDPAPLSAVRTIWARATQEEREAIAAWIDEQMSALGCAAE